MKSQLTTWLLLALPASALAGAGSWTGSSTAGQLSVGGQIMVSQPISAPAPMPAGVKTAAVSWQIALLSAPPAGLQIKLCGSNRCLTLNSLRGHQAIARDKPLTGPWHFVYNVQSKGQLRPALTVVKNQLTVNYR